MGKIEDYVVANPEVQAEVNKLYFVVHEVLRKWDEPDRTGEEWGSEQYHNWVEESVKKLKTQMAAVGNELVKGGNMTTTDQGASE